MFNILALVDINMTNITDDFFRWSFQPYVTTLGQFAYPIFFLLLLGLMYTGIKTDKIIIPAVFMVILGFIGHMLFATPFALLFQFVGIGAIAWIFYMGFIKKGEVF